MYMNKRKIKTLFVNAYHGFNRDSPKRTVYRPNSTPKAPPARPKEDNKVLVLSIMSKDN